MSSTRARIGRPAIVLAILACLCLVVSACSGSSTSSKNSGSANTASKFAPGKATDTVTYALPPAANPNFIWPFASLANFSVVNSGNFQALMYRPLYWYGDDSGGPGLNPGLSLAAAPVYSGGGKTITVKLKSYKWSNGETLTAQDVLFWVNMEKAEKANYAGYSTGGFPDNLTSVTTPDASTIVFTTDKAYSQQWYNENELSQITPMPMAWDMSSASAKGTCSTSVSGCAAVYKYLNAQAKDLPSYATSKLWSVVDGPWKLSSFNSDGHVTFVPNPTYSGPVKPKLKKFIEAPFTKDTAEYNVLQSGTTLDVGYIPNASIVSPAKSPTEAGANPIGTKYNLEPWFLYGINYFPINFNNPKVAPLFKQLYVRQAIQSSVDQTGIIKSAAKGYGAPTIGPIPVIPDSNLVSPLEKKNPYPFSLSKASAYLTDNGWKVVANGSSTCIKPGTAAGECGAGITAGEGLSFKLQYASGNGAIDIAMADFKSNLSKIGIKIDITQAQFNTVIGTAVPTNHTWEMQNWGGGWAYDPDYYPTGEAIFSTGAGSNSGAYSDAKNDALINATQVQTGTGPMHAYADYLATNLPVIWQPNYTYSLTEVAGGLKGFTSQNAFGAVNPENWHY